MKHHGSFLFPPSSVSSRPVPRSVPLPSVLFPAARLRGSSISRSPSIIATVPRSFAAGLRLPPVPAFPPAPPVHRLPSCSPQLGCGACPSLPCAHIYNMYALPVLLTQVKESPEKSFFYKKKPRKVCVFGKKCVPLHPLSTNTAVRRMPAEAHRRYLKDLQYRQTVQEAGIGLRAAWQPLSQMFG